MERIFDGYIFFKEACLTFKLGGKGQSGIKKAISLEQKVRLTSSQAVNIMFFDV